MKRLYTVLFLLLAIAATALAADVTGTWVGSMGGPGGEGMTITYTFKQDGATLTGTVSGPGGEPMQIQNGKIDGNKLSFTINFEGGPNGAMKITNEGTIEGENIKLATKFEGMEMPGEMPPMVLKKTK